MLPMSRFSDQIAAHTRRIEHANRVGWLVQAASDAARDQLPRRRYTPVRLAAMATILSGLLAIVSLR